MGLPQREARAGPLPPVHAVRRRHGRLASSAADAEICMMAADTLERVGIPAATMWSRSTTARCWTVSWRPSASAARSNAGRRLTVLRAIDKLDKARSRTASAAAGRGAEGQSGDFTKGAGLDASDREACSLFTAPIAAPEPGAETVANLRERRWMSVLAILSEDRKATDIGMIGYEEIRRVGRAAGYDDGRIMIDPSVVRGLEYYTGPVYEVRTDLRGHQDDEGQVPSASARSPAADAMTASSRASAARRCRPRASPSASRACWRR
jgi:histidyl-tRNA synthetase